MKGNGRRNSSVIRRIAGFLAVLMTMMMGLIVSAGAEERAQATTMRVLQKQGRVVLWDDRRKERTIVERMQLNDGYSLSTDLASLLSVSLDGKKFVTLEEKSKANVNRAGKMLELQVTEGELMFNVTEPVPADETFDVRTSTMIVGIRGTSGYVDVDDNGHESVLMSDGAAMVTCINPVTQERKYVMLHPGEKITTYLYSERERDTIEYVITRITNEEDLPWLLRAELSDDQELSDRVSQASSWSPARYFVSVQNPGFGKSPDLIATLPHSFDISYSFGSRPRITPIEEEGNDSDGGYYGSSGSGGSGGSSTVETTAFTGTIVWDDASDQDGKRPSAVGIDLKADGSVVDTQDFSGGSGSSWSFGFSELPKYQSDGKTEIV